MLGYSTNYIKSMFFSDVDLDNGLHSFKAGIESALEDSVFKLPTEQARAALYQCTALYRELEVKSQQSSIRTLIHVIHQTILSCI